jgi:predicted AlkP superfamily phosphohydrolase/phosphomutase
MPDQPRDPCLGTFGATPRGGHQLWERTTLERAPDAAAAEALGDALRAVYVACDQAVGRLVEAAGAGTAVLVFSLHGMGPNTSRVPILPLMLERVLQGRAGGSSPATTLAKRGLIQLRQRVPLAWRDALTRRLPMALRDRLAAYWRLSDIDWSRTAAVSLLADLHGYIRINRQGREAQGIVEHGAPFDRLCREIADGLTSFVDADSGLPVVAEVARTDQVLPAGARSDALPDLVVRWSDAPAATHRALRSPALGTIAWPTPGRHPDGRSGNHRPEGFLIAAGPELPQGSEAPAGHILDLAPSIRALLGLPPDPAMRGRSLAGAAPVA